MTKYLDEYNWFEATAESSSLAARDGNNVVERRRRERASAPEHDPRDELERIDEKPVRRRETRTDCEHHRDRPELEEEPRCVPRRGEDQQVTARAAPRSAQTPARRFGPLLLDPSRDRDRKIVTYA